MSYQLPVISVVTPTFNRKDELVYLFDSIKKQTLDPKYFEMIISDDGSTDGTKEYVKSLKNQFQFKLSCVSQKNLGPGSARNNGVKNSKGELIVFIDSDCEADSNWLEIIYDAYKKNKFDAFGGPDEARGNFLPIQIAINFSMTSFLTTGGIRGHNKNMISKFFPRSHNMGVKKKLFEKIGGFGHLRHGQDIELSNRIINENAVVILLKNAVVYHRRRTTLLKFFRQVFNWGVARVNLGKIDSKMLQIVHFLPSIGFLIFIISLICSFFLPFIFIPILVILSSSLLILCAFGGLKTKSIKVMFYLTLIIPCQVFGYGLGFFWAFIKRFIFSQDSFTGFEKNYY
jgi:glycosyltransferase involved in cell wall biosynthesis